jgi:radical SAM protein with 4Fe4S-binding SPASM domain
MAAVEPVSGEFRLRTLNRRAQHRLRRFEYYLWVTHSWLLWRHVRLSYLPEYVSIEVTNVCNFKCAFCPQSNPTHLSTVGRSFLTVERAELLLSRIREAGVQSRLLHWTLDGEPFMNRQFHKLCEVACRWGFSEMDFATNGALCTPRRLQELPPGAHYRLGIDYCADPEYFEQVRGTPGSWERIRRNLLEVLEDDRLKYICICLRDISPFSVTDPKERRIFFKQLKRLFPKSDRLSFAAKTFHNATGFLGAPGHRGKRYYLCPYPWATLNVASNGDVVACSRDLDRKTILGNLLAQSLEEIWNGLPMQALRRNLRDRKPQLSAACAGCDLPYDGSKYTMRNLFNTARGRLQLFG